MWIERRVTLAIRDALRPASGQRRAFSRSQRGWPRADLKDRFAEWKKTHEAELRRGTQPDWTDRLILNKNGTVIAILANVMLILREAPKWKDVLGYDEFNARVVIRKRPPWGEEKPDAHLDRPPQVPDAGSGSKAGTESDPQWAMWASGAGGGEGTAHSIRYASFSSHWFGMKCLASKPGRKRICTSRTANTSVRSELDI